MTFPSTRIRKAAMHYRVAARIGGAPVRISHEYECFSLARPLAGEPDVAAGLLAALD